MIKPDGSYSDDDTTEATEVEEIIADQIKLSNFQLFPIFLTRMFGSATFHIFNTFLPFYMQTLHMSHQTASIVMLSTLGALLPYFIMKCARMTSYTNFLIFFAALALFSNIVAALFVNVIVFAICRMFFTAAYAGYIASSSGIFGIASTENVGVLVGINAFAASLGMLLLPLGGLMLFYLGLSLTYLLMSVPIAFSVIAFYWLPSIRQTVQNEQPKTDEEYVVIGPRRVMTTRDLVRFGLNCVIAMFCGFLVVGPAIVFGFWAYEMEFSALVMSLASSVIGIGAAIAAVLASYLMDKIGPKVILKGMFLFAFLVSISMGTIVFKHGIASSITWNVFVWIGILMSQVVGDAACVCVLCLTMKYFGENSGVLESVTIAQTSIELGVTLAGVCVPLLWYWNFRATPALFAALYSLQVFLVYIVYEASESN